jgi:hypothetical protein
MKKWVIVYATACVNWLRDFDRNRDFRPAGYRAICSRFKRRPFQSASMWKHYIGGFYDVVFARYSITPATAVEPG